MLKNLKLPLIHGLAATRGAVSPRREIVPQAVAPSPEFVVLRPLRNAAESEPYELYKDVPRVRHWTDINGILGWALIALPILCGALYFGLIAADRYVSQTEFVVRNTDSAGTGQLASMISQQAGGAAATGLGGSAGGDTDTQVVVTFMKSYDGMSTIDKALNLRKLFSRDAADFLAAYPGAFRVDSEYRLQRYFSRMINVDYDSTTGVIKLATEAFRPEDAKAIGDSLLSGAEALVNRMDARARQDAIRAAADRVEAAHKGVLEAQGKLTAFRSREKMIDPVAMSGAIIQTIADLAATSATLKAQLSDLKKNAPTNNQVAIVRSQIAALEEQIAVQQRQLAGSDGSMTPALAEYQQLSLQREFADRVYTAALDQAETARLQAARQHVFIERISGPTLADYAVEPRRFLMMMLVVLAAFSFFGMARWLAGVLRIRNRH